MRQLKTRPRGFTLVELMVTLAIASLLALAAAPFFADYGINSRLRESGNSLYSETLFAQSEAIKRNNVVGVSTAGSTVTVLDLSIAGSPVTLRTRTMADGVTLATASFSFGSSGWPTDLAAHSVDLSHTTTACDADYRCPGLRVDAGGAIRLCTNKSNC